ncbi:MAG: translation initiation factor IF-2 [Proteobacteria bacterium]|uniref:Translation initiation factor IF-2 n=2 Tax=Candidatus Fonsibacter lacus TaxID=2576439 RepID=A0A966LVY7_9PROT|nr:translation initiation factor IF-2 [Candidatus Fonsibacter lacus]NDE48593.1 translation initiation factor IF-2 [Pseudomonadota bacterium]NCU50266.1 translation initiation factor IF-2 [Candidatus Fonsibacter lacus]NCU73603.1 translation initiation factor IF-2 [Candidatus Fonsibacter lacus]NDF57688.1 translation initiation factor IF-2 [Pseudomonadota bacterium]
MDVKDKKKKLTLKNFSGGAAAISSYAKGSGNKSVLVEKKKNRSIDINQSVEKPKISLAPQDIVKAKTLTKEDTAKAQKSAQEWARKKIQEELEIDNSKKLIKKTHGKKREYKLTLSKALTDADEDEKTRSLASFKRAREKEKKLVQENDDSAVEVKKVSREISVPNLITIQELANRMAEKASAIIKFLFEKNVKVTINHTIDRDTAEYIVGSFGHKVVKDNQIDDELSKLKKSKEEEDTFSRPPVVTVMGHVDHGKTSLLDALRETNVVATEHGGITQHIGAYQVFTDNNKWMTFIDTPGHAAFTEMRARGSKITDIVVLVVAANDGIKPQTIEAIQHAKAAKVPIIVAINKCDIHGVDKQKVRNQLLEHELVVEELGGDVQCVEISALKKTNLDKLKEAIILQAEILNHKTNPNVPAQGIVIESKLDKGKGPVSTILITRGTLKRGDFFVSGLQWGKIRAMNNFRGELVNEATPSMPVEIIGLTGVSEAGDDFLVLDSESKAKEINEHRIDQGKSKKTSALLKKNDVFGDVNKQKELSIIIKSDVHGSAEALSNAILKIQHDEVKPVIVLSSVGAITETDVSLAKASNAVLIGFNIKPNKEAKDLATKLGVNVLYFNIIYEAIEHITKALSGLLAPEINEQILGQCEILQVFKSSKAGKVAGIKVTEGSIVNNSDVRIVRDGSVVYTGKIVSLYREKNEVKEIKAGLEGGVAFKDFLDFKEKDIIEVFSVVQSARTIN